jgi:ribokinase
MPAKPITVLGIFVADLACRTPRLPAWGETLIGADFRLGPGGKGSNQAVAAARLGGKVGFITKIGQDTFGGIARTLYAEEGIDAGHVYVTTTEATGCAFIMVDAVRAENSIIVIPGACDALTLAEIDQATDRIATSAVFMTNLEVQRPIAERGLAIARAKGVTTVLNPAPGLPMPDAMLGLVDYLTPNETEAEGLTGIKVETIEDAERAADALRAKGAGTVLVTLGARGVLIRGRDGSHHVPAISAGPVVDTTGAGDAFNGGFAVALAEGLDLVAATRFGCAVAGLSVTKPGTAPSMPRRTDVDALLKA